MSGVRKKEDKSPAVGVGVEVVEVVGVGVGVRDSRLEHMMVDKLEPVGEEA